MASLEYFMQSKFVVFGDDQYCRIAEFRQAARSYIYYNHLQHVPLKADDIMKCIQKLGCSASVPWNKQKRGDVSTYWIDGLRVVHPERKDPDLNIIQDPDLNIICEKAETVRSKHMQEKQVQQLMAAQFSQCRMEVPVAIGRVDLVVDQPKLLIEIKNAKNWMHGLGQVLAYSSSFPGYQKILQLFGEKPPGTSMDMIQSTCQQHGVAVWVWPH